MLDKRMLYKDVLMQCPIDKIVLFKEPSLSEEYCFSFYEEGNEKDWAQIETSAKEFDCMQDALNKFDQRFSMEKEKLKHSMIFIERKDTKEKIATALAWYVINDGELLPMLHYVAVKEEYQRLGLGRKVVEKALYVLKNMYPDKRIVLHTQTWSWPAILLYKKLGFTIAKEKQIGHYLNRYEEAFIEFEKYLDSKIVEKIKKD